MGDHAQQVQRFGMAGLNRQDSLVEPGSLVEAAVLMKADGLVKNVWHGYISRARPR
jgi:hypothetical protein